MLFSVYNQSMQQRKPLRPKRDSKPSLGNSHIAERVSTLASNRSQDTKSKIHNSRDSYLKEFKKTKIKLNTLSFIGNQGIEQQIKKEITQVNEVLKECQTKIEQRKLSQTDKQELIHLEEVIRYKDETIKILTTQIDALKKNDRNVNQEDSHSSGNRATDSSDKERIFKLAEEMRNEREQLRKCILEHDQKHKGYLKIKRMIEDIELKYTHRHEGKGGKDQHYHGPPLITYEEFKEKAKIKKEEAIPAAKVKKVDFYHHLSPQKQANPTMNMKDLITRKNITMAALKNSRKKHNVEMAQLIAKLDFLKDEDAHLTQKIKEKEQQLASMEKKFSERKGEKNKFQRSPLLQFHS